MSKIIISVLLLAFAAEFIECQIYLWLDSTNRLNGGTPIFRFNAELGVNQLTKLPVDSDIDSNALHGYTAAVWRPEDGLLYGVMDANINNGSIPKYTLALRGTSATQRFVGEPYNSESSIENNIAVRVKNNEVEMIIADSAGLRAFNPVTNVTYIISTHKNFTRVSVTSTSLYASDESNFYLVNESDGTFEKIANQSIRYCVANLNETMFYCSVKNGSGHEIHTFDPRSKQLSRFLSLDKPLTMLERFIVGPNGFVYVVYVDNSIPNKVFYFLSFMQNGRKFSESGVASELIWTGARPIVIPYFNVLFGKADLTWQQRVKDGFSVFNCTYKRYYWTTKVELQVIATATNNDVPNPNEEFVTFAQFNFTDGSERTMYISSINVPVPQVPEKAVYLRFRIKYTGVDGWVGYSDENTAYTPTVDTMPPVANQPVPHSDNSVSGASRFEAMFFVVLAAEGLLLAL